MLLAERVAESLCWHAPSPMTNIFKTVRDNWRTYLLRSVVYSVIIIPLSAAMIMMIRHEGDASRPHIPELRKIADQIPLYPGVQRTGEKIVLKQNSAYLTVKYQSDAKFADIQAFYARVLLQQGWTAPKRTNSIIYDMNDDHYRRGDYFIAVDQDGALSNSFSTVFIWAPQ